MSTPQAPRSRSQWVVVTAAVVGLLTAYPAAYAVVRVTGLIVHRSWIGIDDREHHSIGLHDSRLERAFKPLVRLEEQVRHFTDPEAFDHWSRSD